MSKSTKSKTDDRLVVQFCGVTGASTKDAKKFLDKYKRLDAAVDAFYNDPDEFSRLSSTSSALRRTSAVDTERKLSELFDKYKDPEDDNITIDGTIKLCEDLQVDPEDVVLLAVAYELKSPGVGQWNKKGWLDGWKALGCDSIDGMRVMVHQLSEKLASDATYFHKVYAFTFEFAKSEGQRSIALDSAQAFWALLLPHGLKGGALSHLRMDHEDGDVDMERGDEEGWKDEYTQWWFDFLAARGGKGVSKDTWSMFHEFVRTIDSEFKHYDENAAWPSTIDDFVDWARQRMGWDA